MCRCVFVRQVIVSPKSNVCVQCAIEQVLFQMFVIRFDANRWCQLTYGKKYHLWNYSYNILLQ